MIRACMFDLDGTILDTIGTITHYTNLTLRKYRLPAVSEEACKYHVGNGARLLIERAFSSVGEGDPAIHAAALADYNRAYDAAPAYLTRPYAGITDALAALREAGLRILVLSNKPERATVPLVRSFFGELIDTVHGGREGVPLKPDPTAARRMLAELGISPEECAYFGDTNTDMQTGRALGAALTVGVTWGFRKKEELLEAGAELLLHDPRDIPKAILQQNSTSV